MSYVTTFFKPCFEERERNTHQMYVDLFTNILEYLCMDGGEQLTSFFVQNGLECIEEHECEMSECFKPSPSDFFNKKFPFTFNNSQCK